MYVMERSTIHKDSEGPMRETYFDSQWGSQPSTDKNQAWNNVSKGRKPFSDQPPQ
jgi:hypothetical protein